MYSRSLQNERFVLPMWQSRRLVSVLLSLIVSVTVLGLLLSLMAAVELVMLIYCHIPSSLFIFLFSKSIYIVSAALVYLGDRMLLKLSLVIINSYGEEAVLVKI